MARKQSAAAVLAERDILRTREHVLSIAYMEQADSTYRHRVGRDTYVWKAYRLTGAEGGLIVATFDGFQNRRPSMYYVERFETAEQQVRERGCLFMDCGMCAAVEAFRAKRHEMTQPADRRLA